jgi:hypothetical protein
MGTMSQKTIDALNSGGKVDITYSSIKYAGPASEAERDTAYRASRLQGRVRESYVGGVVRNVDFKENKLTLYDASNSWVIDLDKITRIDYVEFSLSDFEKIKNTLSATIYLPRGQIDKASDTVWTAVEAIRSDRAVLPEEKIIACAVDNSTGVEIERIVFTPQGDQCFQSSWPFHFSELINRQAVNMRAGGWNDQDDFVSHWSGYRNALWRKQDTVRVFSTACHLDNWVEAETIRSSGDLEEYTAVVVQVRSATSGVCYETLTFQPKAGRNKQFVWEADMCGYINKTSFFIRAGKKNVTTFQFDSMGSSYLNKLWVPHGSELEVTYGFVDQPEDARSSTGWADATENNAPLNTEWVYGTTDRAVNIVTEDGVVYPLPRPVFLDKLFFLDEYLALKDEELGFLDKFSEVADEVYSTHKYEPTFFSSSTFGEFTKEQFDYVIDYSEKTPVFFSADRLFQSYLIDEFRSSALYGEAKAIERKMRFFRYKTRDVVEAFDSRFVNMRSGDYWTGLWHSAPRNVIFQVDEAEAGKCAKNIYILPGLYKKNMDLPSVPSIKIFTVTVESDGKIARLSKGPDSTTTARRVSQFDIIVDTHSTTGIELYRLINELCKTSGMEIRYDGNVVPSKSTLVLYEHLATGNSERLPDMTGFELDTLGVSDSSWLSPNYLLASRDLENEEKLYAWLVRLSDGKQLECVEFTANASNKLMSQWPRAFAQAINTGAKHLRAGGWNDNGEFTDLEDSASPGGFAALDIQGKARINRLWHYSRSNRAFTSAAFSNNWVQSLTLSNGDLNVGDTLWVQVRDITSQYLYETHIFIPDAQRLTQVQWTEDLCNQINRDGKMIRAGVLNAQAATIAAGEKDNAVWIPQCSDLAVTLMPVNWWSQTTVKASRDLCEGESIYCYVWDDFSNAELVPPHCFTPRNATERKKEAWLGAWAAAIKSSPLAPYVRLGSGLTGSDNPGAGATEASVWQIGAPLRVFTTEPAVENWVRVTPPLADLYENNQSSVNIQVQHGLTRHVLQQVVFSPVTADAITDKASWTRKLCQCVARQMDSANACCLRTVEGAIQGEVLDLSDIDILNASLWTPHGSGIEVETMDTRHESNVTVWGETENRQSARNTTSRFTYTPLVVKRVMAMTAFAVAGIDNLSGLNFDSLQSAIGDYDYLNRDLYNDSGSVFKSIVMPAVNANLKGEVNWSDPLYRQNFNDEFVLIVSRMRGNVFWGDVRLFESVYDFDELVENSILVNYIETHLYFLENIHDFILSRGSGRSDVDLFFCRNRDCKVIPLPTLHELIPRFQIWIWQDKYFSIFATWPVSVPAEGAKSYVDSGMAVHKSSVIRLTPDSIIKGLRVLSLSEFPKNDTDCLLELHVPETMMIEQPLTVAHMGFSDNENIWSSALPIKITSVPRDEGKTPDSPLCVDYGNTYRSEVFDVSGQNSTGVDPRTGLFNAHYSLAMLMGLEGKGPAVDLTMHYSPTRANEAGLGDGWAFNFSSYDNRVRTLTLSGGQTIQLSDADITELQDGNMLRKAACRIGATFDTADNIDALTLDFPSGRKELLSLPLGDSVEPFADTVKIIIEKLTQAKDAIERSKEQDKPQRSTAAALVVEVFGYIMFSAGLENYILKTQKHNAALEGGAKAWEDKLPELIGPIDQELKNWRSLDRQLLPSGIIAPTGETLKLLWKRRAGQFLLTSVLSGNETLLRGTYTTIGDVDGHKVSDVMFDIWPDTPEAYSVTLTLRNYLLKTLTRSETQRGTAVVLQQVKYGYSPDPTLDRVLTSIEESDGSLEQVFYQVGAMKFPEGPQYKPALPRVVDHIIQPGAGKASLCTRWTYSDNNYLGYNAHQPYSRFSDSAVKEGKDYLYSSIATQDKGAAITRTWNGLHLQVKEEEGEPSGGLKTTEWTFASVEPGRPLFGLVSTIQTTIREPVLSIAEENT